MKSFRCSSRSDETLFPGEDPEDTSDLVLETSIVKSSQRHSSERNHEMLRLPDRPLDGVLHLFHGVARPRVFHPIPIREEQRQRAYFVIVICDGVVKESSDNPVLWIACNASIEHLASF